MVGGEVFVYVQRACIDTVRVWLEFSHLRKAEDGGEDPRHDKIDTRQLLAELDERSQRECQRAQTLN